MESPALKVLVAGCAYSGLPLRTSRMGATLLCPRFRAAMMLVSVGRDHEV